VTARTAAERLGVDVRTLYAYVSRGALRRVPGPDGRSSRYDADELELLARRSRPRTLPRPAASIDLVVATRVSTVTDGLVRYRGTDLLDLVKAEMPFERVADLLWLAEPADADADAAWEASAAGEWPAIAIPGVIPVLHRFAIAIAAMPGPAMTGSAAAPAAAPGHAVADPTASSPAAAPVPDPVAVSHDWPSCGRRAIACLIEASGPAPGAAGAGVDDADVDVDDARSVARRLWRRWSPLPATPARVRALDLALVLLAEHELALSTLSVRVAASARAAPADCLLAGLSTLSGSLHGGAARTVHERLAAREPLVTGFGHPVHRSSDPRVTPLLEAVRAVATAEDRAALETAGRQAPHALNVDFALGALSYAARMPPEAATAIFAIARVAGWIAHAAEEYREPPLRFRGRTLRPGRTG